MILKASQRAGHDDLAHHLMKPENEHVEVHDIQGFVADTVAGAFKEAYAISRGTRCKQFLFSCSLNPPEDETVPVSVFEDAVQALVRGSSFVRNLVFDGPLIWLLPSRLGVERISGVHRRAFG